MGADGPEATPPSWLDKDFVERALRSGESNPSLVVSSYEITMANSFGDGYSSEMYRITATLEDSQERRMVVKCLPQEGGIMEDLVKKSGIFDIETRMFAETIPAMQGLLEEVKPGEYEPFGAKCLYHGTQPAPFLVLEDLRQSGFTLAKRQQGMDLAHCTLVMRTLARFHATSLALHSKNPGSVEQYDSFMFREELSEEMGKYCEKAMEHISEAVKKCPGLEHYASKFKKLEYQFYGKITKLCERKDGAFNVIIHGDVWTNNMMFKYSGNVLESVRLVDLQCAYYSSPAIDLQYFLYSSPADDVRVQHLDTLLQEYHRTLVETLGILQCSHRAISFPEFKKVYDDYFLIGFMSFTTILPIVISKPEDGFDFDKFESDEGDEIYKKVYSNENYIKVLKRMLPIFEEKGLLDP